MLHAKYLSPSPCGFRRRFLKFLLYTYNRKPNEPPGWGQYWPPGHSLNNLGTASLHISYIIIWKTNDPQGGANIDPRGIIWTILVEVHSMMLHAQYLSPRPCGFREKDFWSFYYIHIWKTIDPLGRGQYWPRGIIWTILVELHYMMLHAK